MKIKWSVLFFFLILGSISHAQIGRLQLSPLQESTIKIGTTDVTLTFCRPSMKGREIFGSLVPYNEWWRTGANRNTTIEFSEDVLLGDQPISKGKYAIFTKPGTSSWEVMLYKNTDNWDVPEVIEKDLIAGTIEVKPTTFTKPLEALAITIGDFTNYQFDLNIAWERTGVSIPIQLTTRAIMEDKISKALSGPVAHDYYAAARYELESGHNFSRGLEWINKAIEIRENNSWWDLMIKSILLDELDQKKEAIDVARDALQMAKEEKHEYGIAEMSKILKRLEK